MSSVVKAATKFAQPGFLSVHVCLLVYRRECVRCCVIEIKFTNNEPKCHILLSLSLLIRRQTSYLCFDVFTHHLQVCAHAYLLHAFNFEQLYAIDNIPDFVLSNKECYFIAFLPNIYHLRLGNKKAVRQVNFVCIAEILGGQVMQSVKNAHPNASTPTGARTRLLPNYKAHSPNNGYNDL